MVRRGMILVLALAWSGRVGASAMIRPMGLYPAGNAPALAMLDSRIDVTVRGPLVETVVIQRFRNPTAHATEATYIFPLPADAAVSAMAIQVGSRTIRAAIEPREAAQRRYEAAIAAGVAGALLEQDRPDVFTQSVAAIPPGGVVEVTLRYDSVARYEAGRWELVLPMVVGPRYVPGTASGRATTGGGRAPDTDRAPDASRVTPAAAPGAGGSTAVAIHFVDPPGELTSPTHELGGTRTDAALSDPRSDHDAIVRWRAPAGSAGWVERDGDAGFAAVVVEAPAAAPRRPGSPLRVILAIDRSATTRGDGDAVEHPVVRALCGALDAADRVRVIGSDRFAWSAPGEALRALERVWPTPAPVFDLTRVLAGAAPDGAAIVLISDGLVADDHAALAAARRLGVAVHVIGIGPAPARAALHQIAAATGGTVRFAVAGDDPAVVARSVVADVASPPAPLTVTWGTLGASDVEPAALPRLGAGQAMLVVARIARVQPANARSRGELFAFEALGAPRAVAGAITPRGALARRWARERLGELVAGGRDRAAVTELALGYGLVSPYTSLVAIGSDVVVSGGVKHSVAVPVSVPSGMQWQAVKQAIEPEIATKAPARPIDKGVPPPSKHDEARPVKQQRDRADRGTPREPDRDDDLEDDREGDLEDDRDGVRVDGKAGEDVRRERRSGTARKDAAKEVAAIDAPRPAPAPPESVAESAADAESVAITGRSRRALRLTAALGGGVAIDHGARGLLALNLRLETPGPTRLGSEAALWLRGGTDPQGRALLTLARDHLARWFELGAGAGVQVGGGTGPAWSLRLRVATPLAGLAGYVRYDAALLLDRPTLAAEHAVTLGVELSY